MVDLFSLFGGWSLREIAKDSREHKKKRKKQKLIKPVVSGESMEDRLRRYNDELFEVKENAGPVETQKTALENGTVDSKAEAGEGTTEEVVENTSSRKRVISFSEDVVVHQY